MPDNERGNDRFPSSVFRRRREAPGPVGHGGVDPVLLVPLMTGGGTPATPENHRRCMNINVRDVCLTKSSMGAAQIVVSQTAIFVGVVIARTKGCCGVDGNHLACTDTVGVYDGTCEMNSAF